MIKEFNGKPYQLPGRRIRKDQKWILLQKGDRPPVGTVIAYGNYTGKRYCYFHITNTPEYAFRYPDTYLTGKYIFLARERDPMPYSISSGYVNGRDGLMAYAMFALVSLDVNDFQPMSLVDKDFEEAFV